MEQFNYILKEIGEPFSVVADAPMPDFRLKIPHVKVKLGEDDQQLAMTTANTKWEWLKGFASGLLTLEKQQRSRRNEAEIRIEGPISPISSHSEDSSPDYSSNSNSSSPISPEPEADTWTHLPFQLNF